jgi:thiol:disulfide interchange protein
VIPAWQSVAAVEAATPLGWPIVWTVCGLILLPIAWPRRAEPTGGLGLALIVSALLLEASFIAISIASDLRYHLWSMTAVALALILLADRRPTRAGTTVGGALLILVVVGGMVSRATLPRAPDNYQETIHWAYG